MSKQLYTLAKSKIDMETQTIELKDLKTVKLSVLIRSVIADVERAQGLGFEINMDSWFFKTSYHCSVCLGGAAALGFLPKSKIKTMKDTLQSVYGLAEVVNHGMDREVASMVVMFDSLRRGNIYSAIISYNDIVVKSRRIPSPERIAPLLRDNLRRANIVFYFTLRVADKELIELFRYINFVADFFEEKGY